MIKINKVEKIAKQMGHGHFTILRFTTNWKGCYGTPKGDFDEIAALEKFDNIDSLLDSMITSPHRHNVWGDFIAKRTKQIEYNRNLEINAAVDITMDKEGYDL